MEKNWIKIADYLENRMDPAGEEAFMRELESDDALRAQFEQELMIHSLLEEASDGRDLLLQDADAHLNMMTAALAPVGAPVAAVTRRYVIAWTAAAALIIGATLIFWWPGAPKGNRVAKIQMTPSAKSRPAKGTASVAPAASVAPTASVAPAVPVLPSPHLDSLFAHYYTPYSADDDPIEVSMYYRAYRVGQYDTVLSARTGDFAVMGADSRNTLLKQYIYFYKGLSYLAEDKPAQALSLLTTVLQKATPKTKIHYDAQWYSVLCYLKTGDTAKVVALAREASGAPSPYKHKAVQLLFSIGRPAE